jgi:hypothetical protein
MKKILISLFLAGLNQAQACPIETGSFKAARASYSNVVECGENGCQIANRKLIFWRPALTPNLVLDNAVPDEVATIISQELTPFGFIVSKGSIDTSVFPPAGTIRVKVNNSLSSRGIAKRSTSYMEEKANYWEAFRGDVEVRLADFTETDKQAKLILHEVLHAVGLDHSEGSHQWRLLNGEQISYNVPLNRIPIMFLDAQPSDGYLQHEDKVYLREALSLPRIQPSGSLRGVATIQGVPVKGMIISLIHETNQELNISAPVDPLTNGSGEWFFNDIVAGKYYIKLHSQICRFGGAGSSVGAYDCSDAPIEGFRWWTGTGWSKDATKRKTITVTQNGFQFIQVRRRR